MDVSFHALGQVLAGCLHAERNHAPSSASETNATVIRLLTQVLSSTLAIFGRGGR